MLNKCLGNALKNDFKSISNASLAQKGYLI